MIDARRYTPTNTRFFTWILRHTYGAYITSRYKCIATGTDLFEAVKPPFIVVGNHSTLVDPFLTNFFVPHPIHWVSSDGNMRNPFMRFLLIKLVGSIPKSKAIPDIETVNWIVRIIRKQKGVVGFYPEGQTTWNGLSLPSFSATAKLMKLLKVPVVCALSKGAYMTKPRWAYNRRDSHMEIAFSQLFAPEEFASLSVSQIDDRLAAALAHDDPSWAASKKIRFDEPRRAEHLELALYACPSCGALQTLSSCGSVLSCQACGFGAEYGAFGEVFPLGSTQGSSLPRISSVADWDAWQSAHLEQLLKARFATHREEEIFGDENAVLLKGKRMDPMKRLGCGRLSLSFDKLSLYGNDGQVTSFDTGEIEGPGVLKWNFFEFYVGKDVYRVKFKNKAASGRKYAVALEMIVRKRAEPAGSQPEPAQS